MATGFLNLIFIEGLTPAINCFALLNAITVSRYLFSSVLYSLLPNLPNFFNYFSTDDYFF